MHDKKNDAKKTILCVDDEKLMLNTLVRILHQLPFNVLTATDGEDALKIINSSAPDLIFLDIQMPKPDGYEILKSIRASGFAAPVVFLTGSVSDADVVRGYETGCSYYITKPFNPGYVVNIVNYFLAEIPEKEKLALELKL